MIDVYVQPVRQLELFGETIFGYQRRLVTHCNYLSKAFKLGVFHDGRNNLFWHFGEKYHFLVALVQEDDITYIEIEKYYPEEFKPIYVERYLPGDLKFWIEEIDDEMLPV